MRVLVAGNTNWNDTGVSLIPTVLEGLLAVHGDALVVITTDLKGAEAEAAAWATENATLDLYEQGWDAQDLLDDAKPDLVLAFLHPGNAAIRDLMLKVRTARIPVFSIWEGVCL